jgi:hypothetical protein
MTEQESKKPRSLKNADILSWDDYILVILAGYFAYQIYGQMVLQPHAYYEAHGCYISDGGDMYTCPNGLPPERN